MSSKDTSNDKNVPAYFGENTASGVGVFGKSDLGVGVHGENGGGKIGPDRGVGVWGESQNGYGVFGSSDNHFGVNGINGAQGKMQPDRGCGVHGESINGYGVCGTSDAHEGVRGASISGVGVFGSSDQGVGVFATSDKGEGVHGDTNAPIVAAIAGFNRNSTPQAGPGVFGESVNGIGVFGKGREAGHFEGSVYVSGRVTVNDTVDAKDFTIKGGDCAEEFEVTEMTGAEPGTVMVINGQGSVHPCLEAYDCKVAGVISGAGFATGITLDKQPEAANRKPLALVGKVFCKVDASYGPIEVGDLLTTSGTSGHAMKATDRAKAFGSVLGKALRPLASGRGLVPILVTLQ